MEELNYLREKIDKVDREMVKLFQERMEIVRGVAEYKKNNSMDILNTNREEQVIKTQLNNLNDKSLEEETEVFLRYLMSISRDLQRKKLKNTEFDIKNYNINCKECKKDSCTVGFQGVPASFSHEALTKYFNEKVKALNFDSFRDVFTALKRGDIQYGILPVENSSTGGITEVYDLLRDHNFYIVGERCLKVEHNLLGTKDTQISDIKEVYSHGQAFMQCNKFFEKHSDWKLIPYINTAKSAEYIAKENNKTKACVASKRAAELYGLKIIEQNINYNSNNYTRFVVVAPNIEIDTKCNKVSIVITLPHEVGTLHDITGYFYRNNLNMTKIESRPVINKPWEYFFYIDFDGNILDENTINTLKGIESESTYFKLLGNFKSESV